MLRKEDYKDAIYKEAMALSTRNFEAARQLLKRTVQNAINGNFSSYVPKHEKLMPTKNALKLFRDGLRNSPLGMTVKNPLNKKNFLNETATKLKLQEAQDFSEKLLKSKKITPRIVNKVVKINRELAGSLPGISRESHLPFGNVVVANPSRPAHALHDLGHAFKAKGFDIKKALEKIKAGQIKSPYDHYDDIIKGDHREVVQSIKNGFMRGNPNKRSKIVGSKLMGAYNEAVKTGDKPLQHEMLANAKSYNMIYKSKGQAAADAALGDQLYSNLSYLSKSRGDKAQAVLESVKSKPFKNKRHGKIDFSFLE